MIKFSFNLPKYRLSISLSNRRRTSFDEPLIPEIDELRSIRSGSKISRFFRYIFEHKDIRKILGTNLTLMLIASSFVPSYIEAGGVEPQAEIVATITNSLTTEKGVRYPVEKVKINQGFRFFHPGFDFDGEKGDPIYPVMGGKIEAISKTRYAYGNSILINHGNRLTSLYAHLSKIEIKEGQEVTINTKIGEIGSTGHSTGPHLHFEIHDHGRPINPSTVLPR